MALYFLTGSANKFKEVKSILPEVEQMDVDLVEIQELDPHKIIAAKLHEAHKTHGGELMVEDTSLYFDGMNGLPGPLNKWFLQALGNEGLYKLASMFGSTAARAVTIIGYLDEKRTVTFFDGDMEGTIVAPRGEAGFGWDVIFEPKGYDRTFAELSQDEKNAVSMRRKAVEKLKSHLHLTAS